MNNVTITNGCIQRQNRTPDSEDSPSDRSNGGGFYNLGNGGGNNPGGDGGELGNGGVTTAGRNGDRYENRSREFTLVKSSNILIQTFSGKKSQQ